jgi:hypothetical protein
MAHSENFSNHVSDVCENLRQPLVSDGARTRLWATMNAETRQQPPAFTGIHDQSSTARSASEPLAVPSWDVLTRSNAVLDGERSARVDISHCTSADDITWYRLAAHGNLDGGSFYDRWFLVGYDHTMAAHR